MDKESIRSPQDVFDWMEEHIEYGWIDVNGEKHMREMKGFRKLYRTMSIEEILKYGMGTCIEQVFLMYELLTRIGVRSQMYCCRIYEPDDYGNLEEDEHMHCFLLYFEKERVYHMEHPNIEKKGIFEYASEEQAVRAIVDYYVALRGGKQSPTTRFNDVPSGLSFKEFNAYINHQEEAAPSGSGGRSKNDDGRKG